MFDLYLACPYSDPDPRVQHERFRLVTQTAGRLFNDGLMVFSPISKTHPIAVNCGLPGDWEFWERYDRIAIGHCRELWVLTLDGWQTSKGVRAEIQIATELQKPIVYIGM